MDHHHSYAASTASISHWIQLFVECVNETDHIEPSQVVHGLLLEVVGAGSLGYTQTAVEQVADAQF